jgi:hypothetical protein
MIRGASHVMVSASARRACDCDSTFEVIALSIVGCIEEKRLTEDGHSADHGAAYVGQN